MRTHQAPSECGQVGGEGTALKRPPLGSELPPGLPGLLWLAVSGRTGGVWPSSLTTTCPQTMVPMGLTQPSIWQSEEGGELGLLFCFLLLVEASHCLLCSN